MSGSYCGGQWRRRICSGEFSAEADDGFAIGALAHGHSSDGWPQHGCRGSAGVAGFEMRSVSERDGESENLEGKVTSQDIGGIYRISKNSFLFC